MDDVATERTESEEIKLPEQSKKGSISARQYMSYKIGPPRPLSELSSEGKLAQ